MGTQVIKQNGKVIFRIRGARYEPEKTSRSIVRIIAKLEKIKDGDLLYGRDLAALCHLSIPTFKCHSPAPELLPYKEKEPNGPRLLWGNKNTIAAFRKMKTRTL
jgi:hypothetical protein